MYQVTVIGCSIIVGLSMIVDPSGTVKTVTTIITIRGVAWIIRKLIDSVNLRYGDIINFTGWALAGIGMVKIVMNAKSGIEPALAFIHKAGDAIGAIGSMFDKILQLADKVTFWN